MSNSAQPSVALVISSLGPGGAERVITLLANAWAERGWAVTIVSLGEHVVEHYPLTSQVRVIRLGLPRRPRTSWLAAACGNINRIRVIRSALRSLQPERVISFLDRTNILVLLATIGMAQPVYVSERGNIGASAPLLPWPWRALRRLLYPRARALVVQTIAQREAMGGTHLGCRIAVIPNPALSTPTSNPRPKNHGRTPRIVAMGRLGAEKGFDTLIRSFASIRDRVTGAELWIWGEGPERSNLEELRDSLGLTHAVRLPGLTAHPADELARADLFVLSSRHEGFPNVLVEAMAAGVPCVAFDCPFGPREIAGDEGALMLVPPSNQDALGAAMMKVLMDPGLSHELGTRGAAAVTRRYRPESIRGAWEALFNELEQDRCASSF